MDKSECISVPEMGKKLGISKSAAYALANQPDFHPAFRIGMRILVNCAALEKWVSEAMEREVCE